MTPLGERVAGWPLHPRLGRALAAVEHEGAGAYGCLGLALLQEKDVLPPGADASARSDLEVRIDAVRSGRVAARTVVQIARQLEALIGAGRARDPETALARALLAAYSDRVCRRREPNSDRARMVGGRGVRLDRRSAVRDAPLFLALVLEDRGPDATVTMASAIDDAWLDSEVHTTLAFDGEKVVATRERRYGDLVLDAREAPVDAADPRVSELLLRAGAPELDGQLSRRAAFAARHGDLAVPDARALLERAAAGSRSTAELRKRWPDELLAALGHTGRRTLDRLAPATLEVPSGRVHPLVYDADPSEPPVLAVKIAGALRAPRIAGGRRRSRARAAPPARPQRTSAAGHRRPRGILDAHVARGSEGAARPLPETPLAGGSADGGADGAYEAALNVAPGQSSEGRSLPLEPGRIQPPKS